MPRHAPPPQPELVAVGWQGVTLAIPADWNVGALSGDTRAGYVRFDDDTMPRLEVKWASEAGFVDVNAVVDKYLKDLQKGRKKDAPPVAVDPDARLLSKRKRRKPGLKSFHWHAEVEGYGAAWACKDCGRTMIAQVMFPPGGDAEIEQELAASILLDIEDHPAGDWVLWSAYGFSCWAPTSFAHAGQRLMAGLIEFEFTNDTEHIKVARWGMANVALKKKTLQEWVGNEMAKTLRKYGAVPEPHEIKGHEGLAITGDTITVIQQFQRFYQHCVGKLYADQLIARAWHCPETNKLVYVETFVDRQNRGLADELVARIECHPGSAEGAQEP